MKDFFTAILLTILIFLAIVPIITTFFYFIGSRSCRQVGEQLSSQTEYKFLTGCWVIEDGKKIPLRHKVFIGE